ncbi:polysaccharide deacetylase family protein [Paenibacillus sp. S150]|uniref:polysaccharide deacetylase family protein n=1 Tax=Paenibacillus sp. S150 TaxID=2749826 RepID=UPI001C5A424B|nr:polysaccharide deacetylase family protein [Paenibacillus sp. S150]MBW4080474.1 polysaccharide deacetylase family protein [Paenibacillus sp. S150]
MKCLQRSQKTLLLAIVLLILLSPASIGESAAASPEVPGTFPRLNDTRKAASDPKADPSIPAGSSSQAAARSQKRAKALTLSQLLRKYPETIKTQGPRLKRIALTFDDVPDPRFTPQILDVLRKHHVKATFFIVGSRAEKHPDLVARIIREGHAVGNHSYSHPEFGKISVKAFRTQIIRTENIIDATAGYKPRLIRPPYGDISEQQLKWAKAHGYKLVNWNVDSLDWKGLSKAQVRNNIVAHAGKGAIILQHGGGGRGSNLRGTIQALPEVISIMRKRGYTFVTVPQMLQVSQEK